MQVEVSLSSSCNKWDLHPEINSQTINNILELTLMQFEIFKTLKKIKISILLTNDKYMRALNKQYRYKDKPTNVLSFPKFTFRYQDLNTIRINQNSVLLGDLVFSYKTLFKEAAELSVRPLEYFAHLLIHGTLHLIGFDHQTDQEAKDMESLEQSILSQFRIKFLNI